MTPKAKNNYIKKWPRSGTLHTTDNSQLKSAGKVIGLVWKNIKLCEEVQDYVSNARIKCSFIVELAPWMGGFYERLVSLVRRALRESLCRILLSEIQLQTLLKDAEAVVNSRPPVYVGDDINSYITLTPGHFLALNPHIGIPELENNDNDRDFNPYESSAERLMQILKKGQEFLNGFLENVARLLFA